MAIFHRSQSRNYTAPFTFELEGSRGEGRSQEDTHARIEQSFAYLHEKGFI
jgi:hypothetical protein